MKLAAAGAIIVLAAALAAPAMCSAQEPVRTFDALNTRLKPGDKVWITDAQGREVGGKIQSLSADAMTLKADGGRTFAGPDVTLIRQRQPDSLLNGALIGLGVGGGLAAAGCVAERGDAGSFCPAAILIYPAMGMGIGVAIDALIPGKKIVVYRAQGSAAPARPHLSIAPVITPHAKGVAVSVTF